MNKNRKKRLKAKKEARKQFLILKRRAEKLEHLQSKMMKRSPGSFIASFYFSPEEIGLTPTPSMEMIQKVGLERALQRLNRADWFTSVAVRVKGENTPEHLAKIREEVRLSTLQKVQTGNTGLDLSRFAPLGEEPVVPTANLSTELIEEINETEQTTD
jgi:hypothetical protein